MVSVKRVVSHSIVTAQVPGESDQPITTGLWAPRRTHSTPPRAPAPRPPPHARDDYLCVKRYESSLYLLSRRVRVYADTRLRARVDPMPPPVRAR